MKLVQYRYTYKLMEYRKRMLELWKLLLVLMLMLKLMLELQLRLMLKLRVDVLTMDVCWRVGEYDSCRFRESSSRGK